MFPAANREARRQEARAALLGAMFTDGTRVWEIIGLDTIDRNGEPAAWLLANIADPAGLRPRDRRSKREAHAALFDRYERVGFGAAGEDAPEAMGQA